MPNTFKHIPVMIGEVLEYLNVQKGDVVCDCTLGGGSHTIALAKRIAPLGLSIGIDQDDFALNSTTDRFKREVPEGQFAFLKGNFGSLDELLLKAGADGVDAFLFDIGVSSPQLDISERGFSYHEDAPLDMRMDPVQNPLSAYEVVNTYSEAELARIFWLYGEEKYAKQIAKTCVLKRAGKPIETTLELVTCIKEALPAYVKRQQKHPARKVFQALRIEVNQELEVLKKGLESAVRWLNPKGRLCVISYHSLEDRIAKQVFQELAQGCICPSNLPVCVCNNTPVVKLITKKALTPTAEEIEQNPRARSAKMRVIEKL